MIFDKLAPNAINAMFRPRGSLYGAYMRNETDIKKRTNQIIELLTRAYGAPIGQDQWPALQISDGKVVEGAPLNSWYTEIRNFSSSIYLTNEGQMSYLIMIAPDVELSTYEDLRLDHLQR